MAEAAERKILEELEVVKAKVTEMDKELHRLREDFADTHLTEQERKALVEALEDERVGKTVSSGELRKRLGL